MLRKLASIQRVRATAAIDGADSIEKAFILGWELVIKKGEFKPGDLCIYMEVDSLLPERPEFEFLRPRAFRVKTIRLRKQVSQGIAFPLTLLPSGTSGFQEGDDVTELLGVRKYEIPVPAGAQADIKGGWPGYLSATDEIRIQTFPQVLDRYKGTEFYTTEKLDGSSMTVFHRDGAFGVCSRRFELFERPDNFMWRVTRELLLEEKLRALGNFALQGELIGPGIQKNKYKRSAPAFYLFNIFDIDRRRYLDFADFRARANELGLTPVPLLNECHVLQESVAELVKVSAGSSCLDPQVPREGLVFRPLIERQDPDLGRLSFKVINPEFLLKYDE